MKYTVEPGRWIYRDGAPFCAIACARTSHETGSAPINPSECDTFARDLVPVLNALPDMVRILRELAGYSDDPDYYAGDIADLGAVAKEILSGMADGAA